MIFLGAGASKAVNLPTLHGLTEQIRNKYSDPFKEIDIVLKQNNGRITYPNEELDLEIFLTILDSLIDPWSTIHELGPFGVYLYKLLEHKELIDKIKRSKIEIRNIKIKSLQMIDRVLRKPDLIKAKKLYDELFSIGNLNGNIKNAIGFTTYNIFDHVATTNYDLVLESYARGNENDARTLYITNRGFKKIPGETTEHLDLPSLRNESLNVHYLKLHGSLDWWERDDKKIVISSHGKSSYGEKIIDHIMIYPVYEKYISREPFYSLYTAFRRILFEEQIVIVIGYSFRDISINNAFLDYLRTRKESRIIICARSDSVKKRITQSFHEYLNRISFINKYFGENGFINELKINLENNKGNKSTEKHRA